MKENKKTINMTELWRLFSKTFGYTLRESREFCEQFVDLLVYLMIEEKLDVTIRCVGGFKHFHIAEKKVKHPKTGEEIIIEAHDLIRFVESPEYKEFWKKYSYGTKNNCEIVGEDGEKDGL